MENTGMLFGRWLRKYLDFGLINLFKVKWAPDNLDGYLNFFSVSADGRVTNWTIVKTKLWYSDILEIPFNKELVHVDNDELEIVGKTKTDFNT